MNSALRTCKSCPRTLAEKDQNALCYDCRFPYWFEQLAIEQQAEVDELILVNRKLEAIRLMKQLLQIPLNDCVDLLVWRFRKLYQSRKEAFRCDLESYWEGFIS